MAMQPRITADMRGILVDWLVEVAEEYRLSSETLYLSIGYIDRFLSIDTVEKLDLQLVGVSAMLIASKYEEIYPPQCDEFVYISAGTYTKERIFAMETRMLVALDFCLTTATAKVFLRRLLRAARPHTSSRSVWLRVSMLANYIAELSLQDYDCLQFLPSLVALSSVCVALHMCHLTPWSATLEHYAQCARDDPAKVACCAALTRLVQQAPDSALRAIREKYGQGHCGRVSRLAPPASPPQ